MTTGLGATFTIEGNPGKDVGTAKTVLQKLVVLAICAFVLAIVNPRMVGFISLCINFRWYFLLTSRTSAPIEQNVVPNCAGTSNTMGRSLNLQQNTACWQHNLTISRLSCEDCLFVIASSSAMMFSTSIHICCSMSKC